MRILRTGETSVVDPHHFDADPDANRDHAFHYDADPDPTFPSDADADADLDPTFHFDADPGPAFHFDADPDPNPAFQNDGSGSGCGSESATLGKTARTILEPS